MLFQNEMEDEEAGGVGGRDLKSYGVGRVRKKRLTGCFKNSWEKKYLQH